MAKKRGRPKGSKNKRKKKKKKAPAPIAVEAIGLNIPEIKAPKKRKRGRPKGSKRKKALPKLKQKDIEDIRYLQMAKITKNLYENSEEYKALRSVDKIHDESDEYEDLKTFANRVKKISKRNRTRLRKYLNQFNSKDPEIRAKFEMDHPELSMALEIAAYDIDWESKELKKKRFKLPKPRKR